MLASHPGMAQQSEQQKIDAGVPVPDTTLPPPPTVKDLTPKAEQQNAAAPATDAPKVDASKADAAVAAPSEPKAEAKSETNSDTKSEPKPDSASAPQAAPEPVQKAAAPAAEPAKPVVVASGVSDQAVADRLREIVTGKQFERIVGRKADRAGVEAFYKAHDYAPIWSHDGVASARAKSAIDYLAHADQVGLDPTDYPTPTFKADMSADALAEAELKLTDSALTFARQAQTGRISFTRVGNDISFHPVAPEPAEVLAKLSGSDDAGKTLDAFNPPQPEFKALREKLAELRSGGDAGEARSESAAAGAHRRGQDPAPGHEGRPRHRVAQAAQYRRRQERSAL